MMSKKKIARVVMLLVLACSLHAEPSSDNPKKDPNIEIKDHCHAHRTPRGCERRSSCYWDYYQDRCLYR